MNAEKLAKASAGFSVSMSHSNPNLTDNCCTQVRRDAGGEG